MGAKESKAAGNNSGGGAHTFVGDSVPQSAALVDNNNGRRSNQRSAAHQQQAAQQQQAAAAAAAAAQQQQQVAAAQQQQQQQNPSAEPLPPQKFLPVVIRYKGQDTRNRISEGQQLFVLTANGSRFPMSRSDDNYYAVVEMPAGDNIFKFCATDGTSRMFVDNTQPILQRGEDVVNVVNVNEVLLQTREDDDAMDDASGWGQERVVFEETRKYPPMLPPHLRYTPLNAPPTQVRVASDGSMMCVTADTVSHLDAEHLPLPLSVTINHIYFQRREDHTITGITTRYRDKYTTVAYYRGTAQQGVPRGSIPIPTA